MKKWRHVALEGKIGKYTERLVVLAVVIGAASMSVPIMYWSVMFQHGAHFGKSKNNGRLKGRPVRDVSCREVST